MLGRLVRDVGVGPGRRESQDRYWNELEKVRAGRTFAPPLE